ncbi:MAG TPA: efflux RND transporter periplasmic adaptor subunit [Gammaproteobacteria bacterium]|nr:efflux RND transporter periplasmic adaptor subunit [Gammaproteobacteria bacterium]
MNLRLILIPVVLLLVSACGDGTALPLPGTLERNRIELVAEDQEPIVTIAVHEGDQVKAGQLIMQLDDRRYRALLADAAAARDQAAERIPGAQATLDQAEKEYARNERLVAQHVQTQSVLDMDRAARDNARSSLAAARSALAQAQASLEDSQIGLDRLSVHAPRDGSVDALPYHQGERPPAHAVVAVLLDASAPYVQVYVPEPLRARVQPGMQASLRFDGVDKTYIGTVRFVSADSAFTPYNSLTERDRSRLAYLAKIYLDPAEAASLPSGLPVSVDFPALHH